ncbi:hypothetical protein [Absidia glauca]|uniref:Ndc10 domain-containing protein n=1 Tax=Absidia glauca TaxID=4829 RepID=A0A168R6K5_ABSGL|nr:hypothetical protein [Absidia glauca]
MGKTLCSPAIRSIKKMRINCDSSARMADMVSANENQIRRRWNNTTMKGTYLTRLPREMMRSMAGFPHQWSILALAALDPPTRLCKKLFPAIGE